MSFSSDIKSYKNRTTDISIFHDILRSGQAKVRVDLLGNEICTGVQKLAQQVFLIFLTELGSDPYDTNKGTEFVSRLRRGFIRTENDVLSEFGAASDLVLAQIQANTPASAPADEQLFSLELQTYTITDSNIMLQIKITTQAATSRAIILPLTVPTSGVTTSIPVPLVREEENGQFKRRVRKDRPLNNTKPSPIIISVPTPVPPPQEPVKGACCLPDGSCAFITATECASLGGTYSGDNISCAQVTCPQPQPPTPTPPAIYQIPYPISQMQYLVNFDATIAYDLTSPVTATQFTTDISINGYTDVNGFVDSLNTFRSRNPTHVFGTYCNGIALRKLVHMRKYPTECLNYDNFPDSMFYEPIQKLTGYDYGQQKRGYLNITLPQATLQPFYDAYEAEVISRKNAYGFKIVMCDNVISTTAASAWYSWDAVTTHVKRLKTICNRNGLTFVINLSANLLDFSNSDLDKLADCCDGLLIENFFHVYYWDKPEDVLRFIPNLKYLLQKGLFIGFVPNPYNPAMYGNKDPYTLAALLCMMVYEPTYKLYTAFTQNELQPQMMRWPSLAGVAQGPATSVKLSTNSSKLSRTFRNGTFEINFPSGDWSFPTFTE